MITSIGTIEDLLDKYNKKYDELEPKLETVNSKDEYEGIVNTLDAYSYIIGDLRKLIEVEKELKELYQRCGIEMIKV